MKMNEIKNDKWSELKTLSFVSSYLKKTILWDTQNPTFRNQVRRDAAHKTLMKEFEFSSIAEAKTLSDILQKVVNNESTNTVHSDLEIDSNIEPNEEQVYVKKLESDAESTKHFLRSLQGIFNGLTYKQNLQARIEIQKVLYSVMNEN